MPAQRPTQLIKIEGSLEPKHPSDRRIDRLNYIECYYYYLVYVLVFVSIVCFALGLRKHRTTVLPAVIGDRHESLRRAAPPGGAPPGHHRRRAGAAAPWRGRRRRRRRTGGASFELLSCQGPLMAAKVYKQRHQ